MYDKDYKQQSSDEIEGYNVKLKDGYIYMPFIWLSVIVMIILMILDLVDAWHIGMEYFEKSIANTVLNLFNLSLILLLSISYYKKSKKEYFFITKDGIEFCEASILKGETQRHMSWDEIDYINIRRRGLCRYEMHVAEPQISTPRYSFLLHWNLKPEEIIKVLKDYSSGKLRIKVGSQFSNFDGPIKRYEWY